MESRWNLLAAPSFCVTELVQQFDRLHARRQRFGSVLLGSEHERSFAISEIPGENARRSQVFFAIQSAGALFLVEEVVIPVRLVRIAAIGDCGHSWHADVGLPRNTVGQHLGIEAEARIALVQRMVIATREKWTNVELHIPARPEQLP